MITQQKKFTQRNKTATKSDRFMKPEQDPWLESTIAAAVSYRRMVDATVQQLTDEEFFARPADGINSVAILLRHLGGNLQSRWTDFLTTDGEKPTRDRDAEFQDWESDRASLVTYFDDGWKTFSNALASITPQHLSCTILIRGEAHTVAQAVIRSLTHVSYHAGQISLIARMVHKGEWQWLTIPPGASADHNAKTWGTAASRSITSDRKPQ